MLRVVKRRATVKPIKSHIVCITNTRPSRIRRTKIIKPKLLSQFQCTETCVDYMNGGSLQFTLEPFLQKQSLTIEINKKSIFGSLSRENFIWILKNDRKSALLFIELCSNAISPNFQQNILNHQNTCHSSRDHFFGSSTLCIPIIFTITIQA